MSALITAQALAPQSSVTSFPVLVGPSGFVGFTVSQSGGKPTLGCAVAIMFSADSVSYGPQKVLGYLSPSPAKGYASVESYQVDARGYEAVRLLIRNVDALASIQVNATVDAS